MFLIKPRHFFKNEKKIIYIYIIPKTKIDEKYYIDFSTINIYIYLYIIFYFFN